jgi:hypothetical protein
MVKQLTETELITMISEESFRKLAYTTYQEMKESESYKLKEEDIFYLGVSEIKEGLNLHYEATLKKGKIGNLIVNVIAILSTR